jgi:hypothetical protein
MQFQLETPKTVTVRQPEVVEISEVVIERVLDEVLNKKVIVWLKNFPHPIELGDLSGDNYDNPQWTNEVVVASVQAFLASL